MLSYTLLSTTFTTLGGSSSGNTVWEGGNLSLVSVMQH